MSSLNFSFEGSFGSSQESLLNDTQHDHLHLTGPVDLNNPFPCLVDEDPLSQAHIQEALISNSLHANVSGSKKFYSLPHHTIKLSCLRHYFEGEDINGYFKAVSGKKVEVDALEYISEGTSTDYTMRIAEHYLDFCLLVPFSEGFGTFLPTNRDAWGWEFQLDLGQQLRSFNNIRGFLGFDPTGSMLYIGRTPTGQVIFLGMAPNNFFIKDFVPAAHSSKDGSNHMSMPTALYWMVLSFFCYVLNRLPDQSFCQGKGPIPVWLGLVSTGIDPMRRGPASLKGPPSLLSQRPKRSLQGLYRD